MTSLWSTVANSAQERQAFHSLLDEYFSLDRTSSSSAPTSTSAPAPAPRRLPPTSTGPIRPSGLAPVATPTATVAPPQPSFTDRASTSLASHALQNTSATSSALRNAGFSAGASAAAAKFGATHHERLAPHVAAAGRSAVQQQVSGGQQAQKGPHVPAGLSSGKSMGGTSSKFDTTSGKAFGKALFTSKGPMSSEEAKKNAFKEPLATRAPVRTGSASPSTIHQPPPMRGQQVKEEGLGRARALYDYEKSDATDLGVKEGQEVVVIEHVSADWWKCRDPATGQEGIVPANYLESI